MARVGLHFPNRALVGGELDAILSLGCQDYLIFLPIEQAGYWAGVADDLKRRCPGARVHVRIERRGALDVGGDCDLLTMAAAAFGETATSYRCRNEPNLESPGVTPRGWGDYLSRLGAWLPTGIREKTFAPALSPCGDWLTWLQETAGALNALEAGHMPLAGLDAHAYGWPSQVSQVLAAYRQLWGGRLLLTETNPGAGNQFDEGRWRGDVGPVIDVAEGHGVEAVCFFIWYWDHPDTAWPMPSHLNIRDYPLVQAAIRAAALAAEKDGTTMPTSLREQYPTQFTEWEKAGGVENNFRAHLIGIGAIKPTKGDLLLLAGEARARVNQLEGALKALPLA